MTATQRAMPLGQPCAALIHHPQNPRCFRGRSGSLSCSLDRPLDGFKCTIRVAGGTTPVRSCSSSSTGPRSQSARSLTVLTRVGNIGTASSFLPEDDNDDHTDESPGSPPPPSTPADSDGKGDGNSDGAYAAILLAAGRTVDSLPLDMVTSMKSSALPPDVLSRYIALTTSPLSAYLVQFPGFRDRLLGDPSFLLKLAIELGIGICTKSTAEYAKRGEKFDSQLDFVAANILMALAADFMLVWLPAPTYAVGGSKSLGARRSVIGKMMNVFEGCPENAFQRVPAGYRPFTVAQRVGAVVRNGIKLFGVGFGASVMGVAVTNGLVAARCALDPSYVPLNAPQDVAVMSAAYGLYMATSSNLRYQVMAGVLEERVIETVFKGYPGVCGALSFALRTGNTFLGSLLWVDFIRLLRLQE